MKQPVFLSVGRPGDETQKQFVAALEAYLGSQGLEPQTLEATVYRADPNPLRSLASCLGECIGMLVLAYERITVVNGLEKGASALNDVRFTTVWNHIEASTAFANDLPVLVLAEDGIRLDGLLGDIYGWKVLVLRLEISELYSKRVSETINDWKRLCESKAIEREKLRSSLQVRPDTEFEKMTLPQLLGRLKLPHLWTVGVALATIIGGVATIAYNLGKH